MFDDFRQQADNAQFEETPEEAIETADTPFAATQVVLRPSPARRILGMTAPQRLVIAILVMLEVCMLGIMFLLVAQKIVPPVFY